MAMEIVDFPIKNGDFSWLRKRLPKGKHAQGRAGGSFQPASETVARFSSNSSLMGSGLLTAVQMSRGRCACNTETHICLHMFSYQNTCITYIPMHMQ